MKTNMKRFASCLMSLLLMLNLLPVSAFAEGAEPEGTETLMVSLYEYDKDSHEWVGDPVSSVSSGSYYVAIIDLKSAAASFSGDVLYDPDVLEVVAEGDTWVEKGKPKGLYTNSGVGELQDGWSATPNLAESGKIILSMASADNSEPYTGFPSFTLCEILFKVKSDVESNAVASDLITVSAREITRYVTKTQVKYADFAYDPQSVSATVVGTPPTLSAVALKQGDDAVSSVAVDNHNTVPTIQATATTTSGKDITTSVTWSVAPMDQGVTINAATGEISVAINAKVGIYYVTATPPVGIEGTSKQAQFTVTHTSEPTSTTATPSSVALPKTGEPDQTLTLSAKDQFLDSITSGITYTLKDDNVYGVSLTGNTVTVANSANSNTFTNNTLTVNYTATVNDKSVDGSFTITREAQTVASVTLSGGAESLEVPGTNTPATTTYTATVRDQYGADYDGTVEWSILDGENPVDGITITEGVVSVTNAAKDTITDTTGKALTVKATVGEKSDSKTLTVRRAEAAPSVVTVSGGSTELLVPANNAAANTSAAFTATVTDQYGTEISPAVVTWTVKDGENTVDGITIGSDGVVSVTNAAKDTITDTTGKELTVTATYGSGTAAISGTATITVKRDTPVATSATISGEDAILVPVSGDATETYTATVTDQYGDSVSNPTMFWAIAPATAGISINETTGVVTVTAAAKEAVTDTTGVTLTITGSTGNATNTFDINVKRDTSVETTVEIGGGAASIDVPADGASAVTSEAFTATVKDQYGETMSNPATVTWTVKDGANDVNGVTIGGDGKVTVTNAAKAAITDTTGKPLTVTATSGEASNTAPLTVKRDTPVAKTVEITYSNSVVTGTDKIGIPGSKTYTAVVRDQYGETMNVTATIAVSDTAGFSVSGSTVSVANTTEDNATATLTASCDSATPATLTIQACKVSVNWLTGNSSITYGDPRTAAFTNWSASGTATAYVGSEERTLNGAFSITDAETLLNAGDNQTITLTFTINDANADVYQGNTFTKDYTVNVAKRSVTPTIGDIDALEYDGSAKTPAPSITWGDYTLTQTTDYTVSYSNNTNAGTATVTVSPVETSNYTFIEASKNFTIDPKPLAVPTAAATTFTYDGNAKTLSLTGFDENTMTVSGNTQTNASSAYSATLALKDKTNYVWDLETDTNADQSIAWTIEPLEVTLTWLNDQNLEYSGSAVNVTAEVSNKAKDTDVFTVVVNDGNKINAGEYTAVASSLQGTSAGNYKLPDEAEKKSHAYTINRKTLTVTVTVPSKEYDGTASISGETFSLNDAVGSEKPAATYTIAWDSAAVGTKGFTVSSIALTSDAVNKNYTVQTSYSGSDETGITKANVALAPEPQNQNLVSKSNIVDNGSQTKEFALNQLIAYAAQSAPMQSGSVSYAIKDATAFPENTVTLNGSTLTVNLTKEQSEDSGVTKTIQITISSDNYQDKTVDLTFEFVDKIDVSANIVFNTITYTYDGTSGYTVAASLSTGATEPSNWSYLYKSGSTVLEEKPTTVGTYTIVASYEDSIEESGLPGHTGSKSTTLTIEPMPVTLRWSGYATRYYDGEASNVTASVVETTPDTLTVTVTGGDEVNAKVSPYTATATELSGEKAGNYTFAANAVKTQSYTINPKHIDSVEVVSSTVPDKIYDNSTTVSARVTVKLNGVLDKDQSQVNATAAAAWTNKKAGTSTISLTDVQLTGDKASNYDCATAWSNLAAGKSIQTREVVATANNSTITYGDAPKANGVQYSNNFAEGEDASVLKPSVSFSYNYTRYDNAGNYTITPNININNSNYTVKTAEGTLTVEPKEISAVTWDSATTSLTYNGSAQKPAVKSISGVLSADAADVTAVVSGEQTNASETAYTATVTALSGAKAANYILPDTKPSTSFTIAKKSVTVENVKAEWTGTEVSLYGGEIVGKCGDDDVAIDLKVNTQPTGVGADIPVDYTASLTGTAAENYNLTKFNSVTVDIAQENVEIGDIQTETTVSSGVDTTDTDTKAVVDSMANVTVDTSATYNGINDATGEIAASSNLSDAKQQAAQALENAGISATSENAIVVVEPTIKVETTDVTKDAGQITSVGLLVQAVAKLIATTTDNYTGGTIDDPAKATEIGENPMKVEEPVTLSIPVPTAWSAKAFVRQTVSGKTYETAVAISDGKISFTAMRGLGNLTLTSEPSGAFQIGDAIYQTLQDAVNNVKDGETIVALKDSADTAKVSKAVSFTLDANGNTLAETPITAGNGYTLTPDGNSYTVTKTSSGGGGGGSSSGGSGGGGGIVTPPAPTSTVEVPSSVKNGTVSISNPNAKPGESVTVTPKADTGYAATGLSVKDSNGKNIPVTKNADGSYTFTMPSGGATVTPTFEKEAEQHFVDVEPASYYADAVDWAVQFGITNGTSPTTFSPNAPCTRAEAVTFLYRAAGLPEILASDAFVDVPADAYYAKAVAWAVKNGITNGTGDGTTFSPNDSCSRAQIVTFLFRFEKGTAASNNFIDVPYSAYYADAVGWAVQNGITNGTGDGTTFSPNDPCTRAQIVTFLYRDLAK